MDSFFIVTSYGRTGTNWLGEILNAHPEICCSHGGTFPPTNKYGTERDSNHFVKAWENRSSFCNIPLKDWMESHYTLKKVRYYGNIHAYNAFEFYHKVKEQSPPINIRVINLLRHPVTRIQSLTQHLISMCKKHRSPNKFLEDRFKIYDQFKELESHAVALKNGTLSFDEKIFVEAVLELYNDYNDFSIPVAHIPCERLFSDIDFLLFTIRQLTSFELGFDDEYIDFIRRTGPKNTTSTASKAAQKVFEEWEEWKKKLVADVFLTRNIFNLYAYFGYDLSFISKSVPRVYFPKTILSNYTPRIGVSPERPYRETRFEIIGATEGTPPVIVEEDYRGYRIFLYNERYYALARILGDLLIEDLKEDLLKIWQKDKKCFISDSIEDLKELIDSSLVERLQVSIEELNGFISTGEGLFYDGEPNGAFNLFSTLLEKVDGLRGILLNNLAVINAHKGNHELAEKLLDYVIREKCGEVEIAERNLKLIKKMKEQAELKSGVNLG